MSSKGKDYEDLAESAHNCTNCPLYSGATQTVFGEGALDARLFIVGEQPGDEEDLSGHPFVGPSGKLLNKALGEAEISRKEVFITNVVKHFSWTLVGQRRLHKKPNAREIHACKPWLEAELQLIKPSVLLLLGATAATAILGRQFRLTKHRGEILKCEYAPVTLATIHPSAILRTRTEDERKKEYALFVKDLKLAASLLATKVA